MLGKKMKYAQDAEKPVLHSGDYILLVFMSIFSLTFLVATFLFLTTGDEMIFVHDMRIPFLSSVF